MAKPLTENGERVTEIRRGMAVTLYEEYAGDKLLRSSALVLNNARGRVYIVTAGSGRGFRAEDLTNPLYSAWLETVETETEEHTQLRKLHHV